MKKINRGEDYEELLELIQKVLVTHDFRFGQLMTIFTKDTDMFYLSNRKIINHIKYKFNIKDS